MTAASDRLRREGPSVHHVLCDLRRPPVGPPKCTCRVSGVAAALADLLEARHRETVVLADYLATAGGSSYDEVEEARHALTRAFVALEAALTRAGGS